MNRLIFLSPAKKTCYSLSSKKLTPEFDGFKIAHISDLHSHPAPGIYGIVSDFAPDITVITGELVHNDRMAYSEVTELIKELLKISPVYIISGNHDLWRPGFKKIFDEFCSMGAVNLDNSAINISRGDKEIKLCGIRDPFSRIPELIRKDINESFDSLSPFDGFKILLFHRANLYPEIKNRGFDLILSGHMHGGQIQIPHIGGLVSPSSSILSKHGMLFPKYCHGIYKEDGSVMVVNSGAGNTLPVPRFFNPPEAVCLTLNSI